MGRYAIVLQQDMDRMAQSYLHQHILYQRHSRKREGGLRLTSVPHKLLLFLWQDTDFRAGSASLIPPGNPCTLYASSCLCAARLITSGSQMGCWKFSLFCIKTIVSMYLACTLIILLGHSNMLGTDLQPEH